MLTLLYTLLANTTFPEIKAFIHAFLNGLGCIIPCIFNWLIGLGIEQQ